MSAPTLQNPRLSVVVTCYNYGHYIDACLESVFAQTVAPHEIIVVDDGSTDASPERLKQYGSRLTTIRTENKGQAAAFNTGFAASRGDLVLFLDADDTLRETALETILGAVFAEDAMTSFGLELIDEAGGSLGTHAHSVGLWAGDKRPELLHSGTFEFPPTSGNVFARRFLETVMPMPEPDWRVSADCFLIRAAALVSTIGAIPRVLGGYRLHRANNYAVSFPGRQNHGVDVSNQRDVVRALNDLAGAPWLETVVPEALSLRSALRRRADAIARSLENGVPTGVAGAAASLSVAGMRRDREEAIDPIDLSLFRSRAHPVIELGKRYDLTDLSARYAGLLTVPDDIFVDHAELVLRLPPATGTLEVELGVVAVAGSRRTLEIRLDGVLIVSGITPEERIAFSVPRDPWARDRRIAIVARWEGSDAIPPVYSYVTVKDAASEPVFPMLPNHSAPAHELARGFDGWAWEAEPDGTYRMRRDRADIRVSVPPPGSGSIALGLAAGDTDGWITVSSPSGPLYSGLVQGNCEIRFPSDAQAGVPIALQIGYEAKDGQRLGFRYICFSETRVSLWPGEYLSHRLPRFAQLLGEGWTGGDESPPCTCATESELKIELRVPEPDTTVDLHVEPAIASPEDHQHIVGVSIGCDMVVSAELIGSGRISVPVGGNLSSGSGQMTVHSIYVAPGLSEPVMAPLELHAVELSGQALPRGVPVRSRFRPPFQALLDDARAELDRDAPDPAILAGVRDRLIEIVANADRALLLSLAGDEDTLDLLERIGHYAGSREGSARGVVPPAKENTEEENRLMLRAWLEAILSVPAFQSGFDDLNRVPAPFLVSPAAFARYLGRAPEIRDAEGHRMYRAYLIGLLQQVHEALGRRPETCEIQQLATSVLTNLKPARTLFGAGNLREFVELQAATIERFLGRQHAPLASNPLVPVRARIRLGVMVRSIRETPEGWALEGMYGGLDPSEFELVLITLDSTENTRKAPSNFADSICLKGKSYNDAVAAIRDLDLDIFVMGCFVFGWERTSAIAAHRLAPVQIWHGAVCPATSGFASFDLVATCRATEPPDAADHYSEEIAWIDGPKQCAYAFAEAPPADRELVRGELGLPDDAVVLVSGAMAHKVEDDLLRHWAAILKAAPPAILVLYPYATNWSLEFQAQNFERRLVEAGLDPDRVMALPSIPPHRVPRILDAADVYLDSFPYTGATTVCEALSRGLPVVTLAGHALRQLTGTSWVRAYGLDELVAISPEDYNEIAVRLINDGEWRAALRARCAEAAAEPAPPHDDRAAFAAAWSVALLDIARDRLGWDGSAPADPQSHVPPVPSLVRSAPVQKFAILSTPRSGSTLLCDTIERAPGVTCHYELFHHKYIQYRSHSSTNAEEIAKRDSDPVAFLEATIEQSVREGAKLVGFKHFPHYSPEIEDLVMSDASYRLILLSRQNRLGQFTSWTIANENQKWVQRNRDVPSSTVRIDWDQDAFETYANHQDKLDQTRLARMTRLGRDVLLLDYDRLLERETQQKLSAYLGISIPEGAVERLFRQNPKNVLDRFNDPTEVIAYLESRDLTRWGST